MIFFFFLSFQYNLIKSIPIVVVAIVLLHPCAPVVTDGRKE